jgi:cation:H+ antiporter
MNIFALILIFIISLVLLSKGAALLVDGATAIARVLKISPLIVGLTVVSVGTSLPEFIVSFFAVLYNATGISVGNIVGSNIANIGLILGLSALFNPIPVKATVIQNEMHFMIISVIAYLILANDLFILGNESLAIEWYDGIVFIMILILFIFYLIKTANKERNILIAEMAVEAENNGQEKREDHQKKRIWKDILFVIIGIIMLFIGGRGFVWSASDIARLFGVSETFIGLTVVSIGTSLPELFTSVAAVLKKESDIVIGNIVGSNIANILFVFGFVSFVKTIDIEPTAYYRDSVVMVLFSVFFLIFAAIGLKVSKKEGFALSSAYGAYLIYLIVTSGAIIFK